MKRVFLSLAALAFVAVGTVSCGGDDGGGTVTPTDDGGGTELTENFIQADDAQSEILHNLIAVHTAGGEATSPPQEYQLEDGTVVIAFEFISHNGSSTTELGESYTDLVLLTTVDTTAEDGEGYVYPLTVEGRTFVGGITSGVEGIDYEYGSGDPVFSELVYPSEEGAGVMSYTVEGTDATDTSVVLKTNVTGGVLDALYSLNVSSQGGTSAKGVSRTSIKNIKPLFKGNGNSLIKSQKGLVK